MPDTCSDFEGFQPHFDGEKWHVAGPLFFEAEHGQPKRFVTGGRYDKRADAERDAEVLNKKLRDTN